MTCLFFSSFFFGLEYMEAFTALCSAITLLRSFHSPKDFSTKTEPASQLYFSFGVGIGGVLRFASLHVASTARPIHRSIAGSPRSTPFNHAVFPPHESLDEGAEVILPMHTSKSLLYKYCMYVHKIRHPKFTMPQLSLVWRTRRVNTTKGSWRISCTPPPPPCARIVSGSDLRYTYPPRLPWKTEIQETFYSAVFAIWPDGYSHGAVSIGRPGWTCTGRFCPLDRCRTVSTAEGLCRV